MKKRIKKDDRLDWRDKDMPVLRMAMIRGEDSYRMHSIKPEYVHNWSANQVVNAREPHYKDDPSYWWSRKSLK